MQIRVEPMAGADSSGPTPVRRAGPAPEPMVRDHISVLDDFGVTRPSVEALHDRFWRNFSMHGLPKSRSIEPLTIELRLSPDGARRGGALTFRLPVFYPCPVCKGTGSDWGFGCLRCSATGMCEADEVVRVSLPPHLRDRDLFQVPMRHHGIQNLALNLLVRVDRR